MHIDIPTLYVLGIGTLCVAAAMTWWERQSHPQRADVLGLWAAAYAVLALGCVAMMTRTLFPGVIGQTLIGMAVVAAHLLVLRGVERLDGPASVRPLIVGTALVGAMWLTLGAYHTAAVWHYIGFVPNALVHAAISWRLWRSPAVRALRSRPLVLGLFLGHTLFCTLRFTLAPVVGAWAGPSFMPTLSAITMIEGLLYTVAIPAGLVALVREEAQSRLLAASRTDYLTGLGNRQAFFEAGERLLACQPGPVTLLAFDLDRFKAINDRHGHAAGDAVLRRFAETAQGVLGTRAVLARIGGEEFAALLPGIAVPEARRLAETLRHRFSREPARHGDATVPATVSTGLASSDRPGTSLAALLGAADRALYRAKASGRDRVEEADAVVGLASQAA